MNQLEKFLCILGAVCLTKGTLHKFSVAGRGKENFLVKEKKQATSQLTYSSEDLVPTCQSWKTQERLGDGNIKLHKLD